MKVRHTFFTLAAVLGLTTAQAQVKVGANPSSITTGAVLDAEGSSGARTVIMNDGRVGVNTSAPNTSADLELGSANKALFLNRVANTAAITAPQPGMVIYDLSANCVRVFQGNPAAWSPCITGAGGSSSVNVAPTNATGSGTLSGQVCFDIAESNDNINSCGVLSGRTANRANFNQAATYNQTYVFTPTGTVSNVRFVYVNTNGQVIQSLTPSANYSGSLSSGSSASAVATYNQDLSSDNPSSPSNGLALGLTSSNPLTADIYVVYNDGSGDKQLKLTANVKDCACCGAYVAPGVWKNFMCYNLGADYTADPFTPAAAIHGAKYQWGSNGSSTSKEGNTTVTWVTQVYDQSNAGSIAGLNTAYTADNTWNSGTESAPVKAASDPCPTGYRIPTYAEWQGVANNNSFSRLGTFQNNGNYTSAGKYGALLVLPAAGAREITSNGSITNRGVLGNYWSSLVGPTSSGYQTAGGLSFNASTVTTTSTAAVRTNMLIVRCIQQ